MSLFGIMTAVNFVWLYLHQSTSLWAESLLEMCPAQTRQSRGQRRGGRSSETLWPSGSWKCPTRHIMTNCPSREGIVTLLLYTALITYDLIHMTYMLHIYIFLITINVTWEKEEKSTPPRPGCTGHSIMLLKGKRFPDYPKLLMEISQLRAGDSPARCDLTGHCGKSLSLTALEQSNLRARGVVCFWHTLLT